MHETSKVISCAVCGVMMAVEVFGDHKHPHPHMQVPFGGTPMWGLQVIPWGTSTSHFYAVGAGRQAGCIRVR